MQAAARAAKRVLVGTSRTGFTAGSWRVGKSHAASVLDEALKPRKGQKRIPKQERRAMMEAFIDKYRASNAGRFPSIALVQKEVGGSYYTAREIVQELEYNHKISPTDKFERTQLHQMKKINIDRENAQKTTSQGNISPSMESFENNALDEHLLVKDVERSTDLDLEVDRFPGVVGAQSNTSSKEKEFSPRAAKTESLDLNEDSIRTQMSSAFASCSDNAEQDAEASSSAKHDTVADTSRSPSGEMESQRTDLGASENRQDANVHERVEPSDGNKASELDEFQSDHQAGHEDDRPSSTSNFWDNLKSFADGFLNLWKKM